jgi:hypothetical protein
LLGRRVRDRPLDQFSIKKFGERCKQFAHALFWQDRALLGRVSAAKSVVTLYLLSFRPASSTPAAPIVPTWFDQNRR